MTAASGVLTKTISLNACAGADHRHPGLKGYKNPADLLLDGRAREPQVSKLAKGAGEGPADPDHLGGEGSVISLHVTESSRKALTQPSTAVVQESGSPSRP